ncbi:FRAS1-related extracellular matrix protein 3-like, partial [Chelonoidis abingdonii]|uniref:FRAS1-related extracellular matrix protein 3-like n=1 Tax=Chelonoidis abingdonii TaxID=106734 RepID=UPI003F4957CE
PVLLAAALLCSLAAGQEAQQDPSPLPLLLPPGLGGGAPGLLVAGGGLRVPCGRSVVLDPAIRVPLGETCELSALESEEPGPPSPGALSPRRFPCRFGQGHYTHYGAPSTGRYRLRLQRRSGSPRRPRLLPLALPVEVLVQPPRLLRRHLPLEVESRLGLSPPLDGTVLGFPEGRCRLTVRPLSDR